MSEKQADREGGAWIGQHPDQNTTEVREALDEGAERVAVTNNESDDSGNQPGFEPSQGHREGSVPER